MIPASFEYKSASSVQEALSMLGADDKILAGGHSLVPAMKLRLNMPDSVIDISKIDSLKEIRDNENTITIGSGATHASIAANSALQEHAPMIAEAAGMIGDIQVRNRGTIGGNIVTNGPCADVLPAVLALEGHLELQSKKSGNRLVALKEILISPSQTSIRPDEILTAIIVRKMPPETRCGFEKLGRRNAMAKGRMNISIVLGMDRNKVISEIRIVPGSVMPVVQRIEEAENMLLGKAPDDSLIEAAADTLAEKVFKIAGIRWSTEYKEPVLKNVFKRVLQKLI